MVQVVEFPAGSRCVRNLNPDPVNQSNPDLEALCDPDLVRTENLRCQKGQLKIIPRATSKTRWKYWLVSIHPSLHPSSHL